MAIYVGCFNSNCDWITVVQLNINKNVFIFLWMIFLFLQTLGSLCNYFINDKRQTLNYSRKKVFLLCASYQSALSKLLIVGEMYNLLNKVITIYYKVNRRIGWTEGEGAFTWAREGRRSSWSGGSWRWRGAPACPWWTLRGPASRSCPCPTSGTSRPLWRPGQPRIHLI